MLHCFLQLLCNRFVLLNEKKVVKMKLTLEGHETVIIGGVAKLLHQALGFLLGQFLT
jgi:hypothetical protein